MYASPKNLIRFIDLSGLSRPHIVTLNRPLMSDFYQDKLGVDCFDLGPRSTSPCTITENGPAFLTFLSLDPKLQILVIGISLDSFPTF